MLNRHQRYATLGSQIFGVFLKEAYLHLVKGYAEDVAVKPDARLSKAETK